MTEIFIAGTCNGPRGDGGWGVIIVRQGKSHELSGHQRATTFNRMELTAGIKALEQLKDGEKAIIFSGSFYLIKGITEWLSGWKVKGWYFSKQDPISNKDLWIELDRLNQNHNPHWRILKGCINHQKELAEKLAKGEVDKDIQLISLIEAAEIFEISKQDLENYRLEGIIPSIQIGKKHYFTRRLIREALNGRGIHVENY